MQVEQKRIVLRYTILIIAAMLIYQFVLGTFIRKSCDEQALDLTVRDITADVYADVSDRQFTQRIYRAFQYHKCINKFLLFNLDGRHDIF